jgi:hypothetical protein
VIVIDDRKIAESLYHYICEAGLPHTADDPTADHGHTQCFWIGLAIQRLEGTMPDLGTSLTIDNILQSDVGKVLDAIREAGFTIEINVTAPAGPRMKKGERTQLAARQTTSPEGDQP